jgi:hypothetical protein
LESTEPEKKCEPGRLSSGEAGDDGGVGGTSPGNALGAGGASACSGAIQPVQSQCQQEYGRFLVSRMRSPCHQVGRTGRTNDDEQDGQRNMTRVGERRRTMAFGLAPRNRRRGTKVQ